MLRAYHRTHIDLLVERIADADPFRPSREFFDEIRVNRLLYQDARSRGTTLSVIGENHEYRRIQRAVQIRVVENHKGTLAAEFHREFFQAGGLDDAIPRRG